MKIKLMLLALLAFLPTLAMATTTTASGGNAAFGIFASEIITWMTGNLGYTIALFSFFGSLLIFAFTHKGTVVIIGIIISILVGGGAGISRLFFVQGSTAFSSTATF